MEVDADTAIATTETQYGLALLPQVEGQPLLMTRLSTPLVVKGSQALDNSVTADSQWSTTGSRLILPDRTDDEERTYVLRAMYPLVDVHPEGEQYSREGDTRSSITIIQGQKHRTRPADAGSRVVVFAHYKAPDEDRTGYYLTSDSDREICMVVDPNTNTRVVPPGEDALTVTPSIHAPSMTDSFELDGTIVRRVRLDGKRAMLLARQGSSVAHYVHSNGRHLAFRVGHRNASSLGSYVASIGGTRQPVTFGTERSSVIAILGNHYEASEGPYLLSQTLKVVAIDQHGAVRSLAYTTETDTIWNNSFSIPSTRTIVGRINNMRNSEGEPIGSAIAGEDTPILRSGKLLIQGTNQITCVDVTVIHDLEVGEGLRLPSDSLNRSHVMVAMGTVRGDVVVLHRSQESSNDFSVMASVFPPAGGSPSGTVTPIKHVRWLGTDKILVIAGADNTGKIWTLPASRESFLDGEPSLTTLSTTGPSTVRFRNFDAIEVLADYGFDSSSYDDDFLFFASHMYNSDTKITLFQDTTDMQGWTTVDDSAGTEGELQDIHLAGPYEAYFINNKGAVQRYDATPD